MFCTTCGKKLPEGAKFCTSCGTPVKIAAPVEPVVEEVKAAAEPVVEEVKAAAEQVTEIAEAAVEEVKETAEAVVEPVAEEVKEAAEAVEDKAETPTPEPVIIPAVVAAAEPIAEEVKEAAEAVVEPAAEEVKETAEVVAEPAAEAVQKAAEIPAPEPAYEEPAPQPQPVYEQPAPQPQPVYEQPAPQPATEKPARYKGPSYIRSLRICSGEILILIFLLRIFGILLASNFTIVLQQGQIVKSLLPFIAPAVTLLLPGVLSLILSRPSRGSGIVLTIIFFFAEALQAVPVFLGTFLPPVIRTWLPATGNYATMAVLGFCLLFALISIFMPKRLVQEPELTAVRPVKIIYGILHLIGGIVVVIYWSAVLALFLTKNVEISGGFGYFMNLLLIGLLMIFAGASSVSAPKAPRVELSAAFLHFAVIAFAFLEMLLLAEQSSFAILPKFSGGVISIEMVILLIVIALLAVMGFYGLCFLIQLLTTLIPHGKKRKMKMQQR